MESYFGVLIREGSYDFGSIYEVPLVFGNSKAGVHCIERWRSIRDYPTGTPAALPHPCPLPCQVSVAVQWKDGTSEQHVFDARGRRLLLKI